MSDCSGCGKTLDGGEFCRNCGRRVAAPAAAIIGAHSAQEYREPAARVRSLAPTRWALVRTALLLLLAGVLWVGYLFYQRWRETEHFAKNVQCAQLARDFAKSRASDEREPVVISAFYSSKRTSCVAALERQISRRSVVDVVDPVTGEVMWVEGCDIDGECNAGLEFNMRSRARDVLDKWADTPLDRPLPH